jgi:tetratricopeptide (TPR) repeat protein
MPMVAVECTSNKKLNSPLRANQSRHILLAALALAVAVLAVYQNIFDQPFIFDDQPAILENPTITQLWPPWTALGFTNEHTNAAVGRPVVNYSFALNYAVSGFDPWSYHALNLIIHALATWVLFGVIRRTLRQPVLAKRLGDDALPLAFFIALLWAVHPLLTESVTSVVQRTESLGALFYLLTLYCFIRSLDSRRTIAWLAGAVATLLLGLASKETVATAPVIILLYDRTFIAGTFGAVWRLRRKFFTVLASSWLFLAGLMWNAANRGGTVGFGLGTVWWEYALKQCAAVPHYFMLALWPHPLAIDYGKEVVASLSTVWLPAVTLAVVLAGTLWALVRHPAWGFLGAWVFIILAPSSSFVPLTTQTEAEHRMYMPLAALVVLVVVQLYAWAGRRAFALAAVLTVAMGLLTFQRNQAYQTAISIWQDDVNAVPANARAHQNFAAALGRLYRGPECIEEYELALRLDPTNADVENSAGYALAVTDHLAEALFHYRRAIILQPDFAAAQVNLGNLLKQTGHLPEAMAEYHQALRNEPDSVEIKIDLADAYNLAGHPEIALPEYQSVLSRYPTNSPAHVGLGNCWMLLNRLGDAKKEYELSVQLDPESYLARYSLGMVLSRLKEYPAAHGEFEAVLREQPNFAPAQRGLLALPKTPPTKIPSLR